MGIKTQIFYRLNIFIALYFIFSVALDFGYGPISQGQGIYFLSHIQKLLFWPLAALIFLEILFHKRYSEKGELQQIKNNYRLGISAIFIILIAAFWVRISNLGLLPLNHDESFWGIALYKHIDARCSQLAKPYLHFLNIPILPLQGFPIFITKAFLNKPDLIVRLPSVILGVATVFMNYLLAKEAYGKRVGLVSSLFLALLPWHVIFSRTGVSVILTPLFGCLIFYCLCKAIGKKDEFWFLLACFFLGIGAFYSYAASLLFVPIFLVALYSVKKECLWFKKKISLLCAGLIILFLAYPFILNLLFGPECIYMPYQRNVFMSGNILYQICDNASRNFLISVKILFLSPENYFLYGHALGSPLLLNPVALLLLICAIGWAFYRRTAADKIYLIWLILGFIMAISFVNFAEARYLFIIIPVPVVLMARLIDDLFLGKAIIRPLGIAVCLVIVFVEIGQLCSYFHKAATDSQDSILNSYGCKEAAEYLSGAFDIKDAKIVTDRRMTVKTYLGYLSGIEKEEDVDLNYRQRMAYFVIWAPESHPGDYWGSLSSYFKQEYPGIAAAKTIYYPDGRPAINIFRVE